jgi:hypothetical protein
MERATDSRINCKQDQDRENLSRIKYRCAMYDVLCVSRGAADNQEDDSATMGGGIARTRTWNTRQIGGCITSIEARREGMRRV